MYSLKQFVFLFSLLSLGHGLCAQIQSHRPEIWLGYISSIPIKGNWSFWNDFHYVPQGFFASRQGISYRVHPQVQMTVGYAWVTTATPSTTALVRPEHRPWGQIEWRRPLSAKYGLRLRYRHDWRFRRALMDGEVQDNYIQVQRYRFMFGLQRLLKLDSKGRRWQLNLLNELLLQTGQGVSHPLDQNRSYLLLSLSQGSWTWMGGYDFRLIRSGEVYNARHGLTLWAVHNFELFRKKPELSLAE